jgi:hypothetical protein
MIDIPILHHECDLLFLLLLFETFTFSVRYVSATLGSFPTGAECLGGSCIKHTIVRSRLLLGLSGVIIVLLSVGASLGFWSAVGFV